MSRRSSMSFIIALSGGVWAASAGLAQQAQPEPAQQAQQPDAAVQQDLTTEQIKDSLLPNPTEQGTRPPGTLDEEDVPILYDLLARVRRSPPSLEGEPIPRPNAFASEPAREMTPQQPRDVSLFVEEYIE